VSVFDVLATPVALVLKQIHAGLSTFLSPSSGPAWGLSIVLLTVAVRLLLFPLFVKQIKSQRRMQELAPKIKALQAKHKGDRETLNTELMKLYKDHGANPISGCLPLVLQLPVFFALFTTIREFKPDGGGNFHPKYGLSAELLRQGSHAKVFGAPVSAAFNSSADLLRQLDGNGTTVKIVSALMIVIMGASTFYTQRQMMARNTPGDAQQAQVQKVLLYVLPLSFAFFGFSFPVGVLLYWLTTNLWSMGQQAWVIKRMPPVVAGALVPAGASLGSRFARRPGAAAVAPSQESSSQPKPGAPKQGPPKPSLTKSGQPASSQLKPSVSKSSSAVITAAPSRGVAAPRGAVETGGAAPARSVTTAAPPAAGAGSAPIDRRPSGSRKRKSANRRGGRR
jgi:YidC/Oxa1 family membrane protein insertase